MTNLEKLAMQLIYVYENDWRFWLTRPTEYCIKIKLSSLQERYKDRPDFFEKIVHELYTLGSTPRPTIAITIQPVGDGWGVFEDGACLQVENNFKKATQIAYEFEEQGDNCEYLPFFLTEIRF